MRRGYKNGGNTRLEQSSRQTWSICASVNIIYGFLSGVRPPDYKLQPIVDEACDVSCADTFVFLQINWRSDGKDEKIHLAANHGTDGLTGVCPPYAAIDVPNTTKPSIKVGSPTNGSKHERNIYFYHPLT